MISTRDWRAFVSGGPSDPGHTVTFGGWKPGLDGPDTGNLTISDLDFETALGIVLMLERGPTLDLIWWVCLGPLGTYEMHLGPTERPERMDCGAESRLPAHQAARDVGYGYPVCPRCQAKAWKALVEATRDRVGTGPGR